MRGLFLLSVALWGSVPASAISPEEEAQLSLLRSCSGRTMSAADRTELAEYLSAYLVGAHEGKFDNERLFAPHTIITHFARRYLDPAHSRAYVQTLAALYRANRLEIPDFGLIHFSSPERVASRDFWSQVLLPLSRRTPLSLAGLSMLFRLEDELTGGNFLRELFPQDMYEWISYCVDRVYAIQYPMSSDLVTALRAQLAPPKAPSTTPAAVPQTGALATYLAGIRTTDYALRAVFDAELREKLAATVLHVAETLGDDRARMRLYIETAMATRVEERPEAARFVANWVELALPLATTRPLDFWWSLFGWAGKQGRGTLVALVRHLPTPDSAPANVAAEVRRFLAEKGQ